MFLGAQKACAPLHALPNHTQAARGGGDRFLILFFSRSLEGTRARTACLSPECRKRGGKPAGVSLSIAHNLYV